MGGRSRFSVCAFLMDYTKLQVQTPIQPGVIDIRNAAAATIRGLEVENTTRIGRGLEARGPCHLARRDVRSIYRGGSWRRHGGCRGPPAEQCARMGGPRVGRMDGRPRSRRDGSLSRPMRRHSPRCSTHRSGIDSIQRQAPYGSPRRPCRIRSPQSSLVHQRVRTKRDGHGLRDGHIRDLAGRVRGAVPARRVSSRSNSRCDDKESVSHRARVNVRRHEEPSVAESSDGRGARRLREWRGRGGRGSRPRSPASSSRARSTRRRRGAHPRSASASTTARRWTSRWPRAGAPS